LGLRFLSSKGRGEKKKKKKTISSVLLMRGGENGSARILPLSGSRKKNFGLRKVKKKLAALMRRGERKGKGSLLS